MKTSRFVAAAAFCALLAASGAYAAAPESAKTTTLSLETAEWAVDLDCSQCHAKQQESCEVAATRAAPDTAGEDEEAEGVGGLLDAHVAMTFACTTCHYESEILAVLHEEPNPKKKVRSLKKTDIAEGLCLNCHNAEDLAKKTEGLDILTDENGTKVNPHELPDAEGHAGLSCIDCHVAHERGNVMEVAPDMCTNCHHANVYECGTCHK